MDISEGKKGSTDQEEMVGEASVLGEKSEKEYNFCPNCGNKLEGLTKLCVSCGQEFHFNTKETNKIKFTSSINYSNFFQKISPTKEKIVAMKGFIINNFELTHILYFAVFLITLASIKWGFIMFFIMTISYYVLSVTNEEELSLNSQIKELLGAAPKQFEEAKGNVMNKWKSSSESFAQLVEFVESKESELYLETPKEKVKLGLSGILLVISGLITIFGSLSPGFFNLLDYSLIKMITTSSEYVGYFEDVEDIFTGSNGNGSSIILIIGYSCLIIPIIIIVLTLLNSRLSHSLAFSLAVLEFFLVLAVVAKLGDVVTSVLGDYSDNFYTLVFEYNALGFPAYAFTCGIIGMIIFSVAKLSKSKLRFQIGSPK